MTWHYSGPNGPAWYSDDVWRGASGPVSYPVGAIPSFGSGPAFAPISNTLLPAGGTPVSGPGQGSGSSINTGITLSVTGTSINVVETLKTNLQNQFVQQVVPTFNKQIGTIVKERYGGDYSKMVEAVAKGDFAFAKQSQAFSWDGRGEILDAQTYTGQGVHISDCTVTYSVGVSDGGLVLTGTFGGTATAAYYLVVFGVRSPDLVPAQTTIDIPIGVSLTPPE